MTLRLSVLLALSPLVLIKDPILSRRCFQDTIRVYGVPWTWWLQLDQSSMGSHHL